MCKHMVEHLMMDILIYYYILVKAYNDGQDVTASERYAYSLVTITHKNFL